MKRKIFIICMIFLCLFLCFLGYKFIITGNNKNIENVSQVSDYILNIKNYNIEANVTVYSNKNSNTYNLNQYKMNDYQRQEIINNDENYGLIIESENGKITIKNTALELASVFENYNELTSNAICLNSFIEDYKIADETNITEDEEYYILFVKAKNSHNKYVENKTLYVSKKSNKIEKIEVKDVNNNRTVLIEYTRFEIL